jgi:hypothetical protein
MTSNPRDVARADQQLAAITATLDELIDRWKTVEHPGDHMYSIGAFMITEVDPRFDKSGVYAALTIAIERLAS